MPATGYLGFVVQIAGQLHQECLWHLYNGLHPIPKKLITYGIHKGGWADNLESLVLLKSRSVIWKAVNRGWRELQNFSGFLTERRKYVQTLPIEWKKRFHQILGFNNLRALLIIHGECGVAMLDELKCVDIPVAVLFCRSDAQMGGHYPWYARKLEQLWRRVDLNIFVSEFLLQQAVANGCPAEKSRVIYMGCATSPGRPDRPNGGNVRFICVANLHPVKGTNISSKLLHASKTDSKMQSLFWLGAVHCGKPLRKRYAIWD